MTVAGQITDEQIAMMLAAAEKATPGPWEARTQAEWTTGYDFFAGKDGAFCFPVDLEAEDAAHINNCDPAAITAALTELQHRREAEATWHALDEEGYAELRVCGKRITTFASWPAAEEAADRINSALAASPSSPASGVRVKASLSAMIDWVQAALDCNDWYWSSDQREAAELELATARSALGEQP
jgi:hypothetical protein